jgi:hypothetical protein
MSQNRPPPPKTHNGDLANPPAALAQLCLDPRWVCWRWTWNGKVWTKPPYRASDPAALAKNNDPATWSTRSIAVKAVLAGKAHGVGFALANSNIAALDLDKCRDPETGAIDDWAQQILNAAPNAYQEVTVSGCGLRIIGFAAGPENHRKFSIGGGSEGAAVEVYRKATRYITVSGLEISRCAALPNIDKLIDDIIAQYDRAEHSAGNGRNTSGGEFAFDDIDTLIKNGAPETQRSEAFARCVWSLAGRGLSADKIEARLRRYPNGIAAKYIKRLRPEINRCYAKWRKAQEREAARQSSALQQQRKAVLVEASKLKPESVSWAWRNRLAFGKLNVVAGDPGLGKSTLLLEIAALHSIGGEYPCGEGRAPQCETLILTAEDGLRDTMIPRLIAAGADLSKIRFLVGTKLEGGDEENLFDLARDISALREVFKSNPNIRFLIIDPLTAYLGATKAKENSEVRRVLAPLVKLVEETGVMVIANNHLNKGAGKALYRVLDSIAFVAVGRIVHLVIKDADNPDNRKFICDKTNIGSRPMGLSYFVQKVWIPGEHGEEIETSRICWGTEHINETADEALGAHSDPTAADDAVEFLKILLAKGPMRVPDIEREARTACLLGEEQSISQSKAFRSARKILKITTAKGGLAEGWLWSLP